MPSTLTITIFAFAILLALMGWEIGAAIAGGLAVVNQALVNVALMRAINTPAEVPVEYYEPTDDA